MMRRAWWTWRRVGGAALALGGALTLGGLTYRAPLLVLTLLYFGVAGGAAICARLTQPDRNYWPMMRVLWTLLGFAFFGSGVASLFGAHEQVISTRLIFMGAIFVAILYSIYFMRRRNHTARFLPIQINGQIVYVDRDHLRQQVVTVISLARHGAMPPEWVAELEAATVEAHEREREKATLLAQGEARRRRKRAQGA